MYLDGSQKELMNKCKFENLKLDETKNINTLINESYENFREMLTKDNLSFQNKKIIFKTEMDLHNNKELGFEHIVSMKNEMSMRLYDKNRMLYVPLIEKILQNCCNGQCNEIKIYKDKKDICIWCKKLDYLIVLSERKEGYLLQTAYPIIYEHKRNQVEKKANENGIF